METKPYNKLIETDFDELERLAKEQAKKRVFSEEEYSSAEKTSFDKGVQEGLRQALETQQERIALCLENLKMNVMKLMEQQQTFEEDQQKDIAHLSANIFEKVFPTLIQKQGNQEIIRLLQKALSINMRNTILQLNVSPENKQDIEIYLAQIAEKNKNKTIVLNSDESLSLGDCTLEWENGGIHRVSDKLWLTIQEQMEQFLAGESIEDWINNQSHEPTQEEDPQQQGETEK